MSTGKVLFSVVSCGSVVGNPWKWYYKYTKGRWKNNGRFRLWKLEQ